MALAAVDQGATGVEWTDAQSRGVLMRSATLGMIAGLIAAVIPLTAARGEVAPAPTFATSQCDPRSVYQDIAPRVQCGTVAVPRDYAHPECGTFRLAVTAIAGEAGSAEPDLYISGGPGGP